MLCPAYPARAGLDLTRLLDERPEVAALIRAELESWDNRSVTDELEVLRRIVATDPLGGGQAARRKVETEKQARPSSRAKTTFQMPSGLGTAKCTAANGRLEIKLARDFSTLARRKPEAAVLRLLHDLD